MAGHDYDPAEDLKFSPQGKKQQTWKVDDTSPARVSSQAERQLTWNEGQQNSPRAPPMASAPSNQG